MIGKGVWAYDFSVDNGNSGKVFYADDLSNVELYVPNGTKSEYELADVWKDFGTINEYSIVPDATLTEMGYTIEKDVDWYEGIVNGVSFLPDGYEFGSGVDALSYTAADNGIVLNGYEINRCTNEGLEWFYLQFTGNGVTCEPGKNGLVTTKNERWFALEGLRANQIIAFELTDTTEAQFVVSSTACSNKTGWADVLTEPVQAFEITDSIHQIQQLKGQGVSGNYRFYRVNPESDGWIFVKFNGKSPNKMLRMQIWSPKQDGNNLVYNGGFEYTIEKDVDWYEGTVNGVSFLPDGYEFGSGVDALSYTAAENGIVLNGYEINRCTNEGLEWFYLQFTGNGVTCEPGKNGLVTTKNERWFALEGLRANQIIAFELTDTTKAQFVVSSTACSSKTGWADVLTEPVQAFEITDSIHQIQQLKGQGVSGNYRFYRVNPESDGWIFVKFNGKSPNKMLRMQIWSPKQDGNNLVYNGGFEEWTSSTQPTGWEGWQIAEKSNTGGAKLKQSTDSHSGDYACYVEGASSNKRLATQKLTLPADTYVVSFWAKSDDGGIIKPGMATIQGNGSTNYNYGDFANEGISLTSSWEQYSYEFTLDEMTDVSMVILNVKNTGGCYIDDYCLSSKSIVSEINHVSNQLVKEDYYEGDTIMVNGQQWRIGPNVITNPSFDADPAKNAGNIVGWTNGTYAQMTTNTFLWHPTGGHDGGAYIQANKHTGAAGDGSVGQRWALEPNSYYYFSFWLSNNSANNQYIPAISLTANESTTGGRNERTDVEDDGPTALNSGCLIGKNGETSAECLGYGNFIDSDGDGYGEWAQTGMIFESEEYTYLQFNARWLKENKIQVCFDDFHLHKLYPLQSSPIIFEDAIVKSLCVSNWDMNHDGELSYDEAAAVADICNVFKDHQNITEFNELKYFTGLTKICDSAFAGCKNLVAITLPTNINSIGHGAFSECMSLPELIIPESVSSIGSSAFYRCLNLLSIEIPASVSNIGTDAFASCGQLKKVAIKSNTLLSKTYTSSNNLYYGFGKQVEEIIIGESVSSIGNYAFYNGLSSSSKIKSITLPNSVKKVGDYAFYGHNLTSLHMSKNIEHVGYYAFIIDNLSSIEQIDCTHTSATFNVKNNITADSDITTNINGSVANKKGTLTVEDLAPGSNSYLKYSICCNNVPIGSGTVPYNTKSFQPTIKTVQVGPTNIKVMGTYTDDSSYKLHSVIVDPISGSITNGNTLSISNLRPNYDYLITYRVYYSDDKYESKSIYASTQSLTLQTINPRVTTNTSAVVSAETNISDEETHVGFEWRKIDAPDVIPSKSGAAVIYDGLMEGEIKGLDSSTYYKVRPYYEAYDGTRYYGEWIGFDPSDFSYFEPTVHTYAMTSEPTDNNVNVRGYAVAGTDDIKSQGFEYWPSNSPLASQTVSATGQAMTATLKGLKYNTEYTVRAFVSTSAKTAYGESVTFKTPTSTGIEDIAEEGDCDHNTRMGVYDIQGRLVDNSPNADPSTLKQGIYIINGKKILMR